MEKLEQYQKCTGYNDVSQDLAAPLLSFIILPYLFIYVRSLYCETAFMYFLDYLFQNKHMTRLQFFTFNDIIK